MFIESLEQRSFLSTTPVTSAVTATPHAAVYATAITKPQPPTNVRATAGSQIINGTRVSTVSISYRASQQPAGSVIIGYYVNIVYNNEIVGTVKIKPNVPVTIGGFKPAKNYFIQLSTIIQTGKSSFATSVSSGVWVKTV